MVTGGAGFIGSHVAEALLARGDEVHVLDSLVTGSREKVPAGAELHVGDIRTDAGALFESVRPELCVHLAAQADVGTSVERPDYDAEVNVLGTVRVLEAARTHGTHVVFSSTGGATGRRRRMHRGARSRRTASRSSRVRSTSAAGTGSSRPGTSHCGSRTSTGRGRRRASREA